MTTGGCVPSGCRCDCHNPGLGMQVSHVVACCDKPPALENDRVAMMFDLVPDKRTPEQRLLDAIRTGGESLKFTDTPVRQRSVHGQPRPQTTIERTCRSCGASFLGLAPGKTGERGLWSEQGWYCSVECHDKPNPT